VAAAAPPGLRMTLVSALIAAILLATVGAVASDAKRKPRSYANCTALNGVYPHGVGLTRARDRTSSGDPVTNFMRSKRLYIRNDGGSSSRLFPGEHDLDRDNDGVACEQH
jgi:hypothetical protein